MPELDTALQDLLRADAAGVVVPPAERVRERARRRRRATTAGPVAAVAAVLVLALGGVPVLGGSTPLDRLAGGGAPVVLDEGVDDAGPWRLEWTPGGRCLTRVRADGEGGSCDLADPPDLRETRVDVVGPSDAPETLVAGLAPAGTTAVRVTPSSGEPVEARVVRSGDATLFVARLPGVTGVAEIVAVDGTGAVLDAFDGPALPPPPVGGPVGYAPGARGYVEAPWTVTSVGADRRSALLAVRPVAGGCTGAEDVQALDMPEGLRLVVQVEVPLPVPPPGTCPPAAAVREVAVDLPRPLRQGEAVLGACDPAAPECAALRPAPGG